MFLIGMIALAIFIVGTIFTEIEKWGLATLTLIASVVAMHYFNVFDIITYVRMHVIESATYAGVYIATGVPWSFIKWFSFLYRFRDEFREAKELFKKPYQELRAKQERDLQEWEAIRAHEQAQREAQREKDNLRPPSIPSKPVPSPKVQTFEEAFKEHIGIYKAHLKYRPTAAENKSRITAWMLLWPFSLVGTILNDPVRRLGAWLFNRFKSLYQKSVDYVFRNDPDLV